MSDLLTQLRIEATAEDHRGAGGLCRDAANEIERLQMTEKAYHCVMAWVNIHHHDLLGHIPNGAFPSAYSAERGCQHVTESFLTKWERVIKATPLNLAKPSEVEAAQMEKIYALAEAMWQLLDDMGRSGQSVCLAAKAQARLAYEPFRDPSIQMDMSIEEAECVIDALRDQ